MTTADPSHEEEQASGILPIRKGARILLVEDDEINQALTRDLLESAGLGLDIAKHGGDALEKIQAGVYDLVLMDIQMPVMDGLEATRKIRAMEVGKSIPILAMTANAFSEDRQRCLDAGMNGYLTKPIEYNHLIAQLARWIPETGLAATDTSGVVGLRPELAAAPTVAAAHIDAEIGLKYFGGMLPSYQRRLGQFADQHADAAAKLQAALDADELATAKRIAHSLKSMSAMLGALELNRIADELEHGIHDGADRAGLAENLAELAEALAAVCAEIQGQHLSGPAATAITNSQE